MPDRACACQERCGLLDSGLAELSSGLKDHSGQLEFLSLRQNMSLGLKWCEDTVLTVMAEVYLQKAEHLGLLGDDYSFVVAVFCLQASWLMYSAAIAAWG